MRAIAVTLRSLRVLFHFQVEEMLGERKVAMRIPSECKGEPVVVVAATVVVAVISGLV